MSQSSVVSVRFVADEQGRSFALCLPDPVVQTVNIWELSELTGAESIKLNSETEAVRKTRHSAPADHLEGAERGEEAPARRQSLRSRA